MGADIAQLMVVIKGDTQDAEKKISGVNDAVGKSGGFFKTALSSALGFASGAAIVQGVGTAIGFVKDNLGAMVSAGEEANSVMAQTVAGLKSTHDASGMTAQSIDDLATKTMNLTGIDDDSVHSAENMLLTFTNIGKDVFPQATQAVADLATKMNNGAIPSAMQMQQASIQLGKALGDPLKGYTALQRVGVTFSEQQKEQIKHFMAVGDVAGAQNVILKEMNKEFGGSAAAAGEANGGLSILKAQFDNMKQTVGQAVIPILLKLMDALKPITSAIGEDLPKAIKFVQGIFKQWSPVINQIVGDAKELGDIFMKSLKPGLETITNSFKNAHGPGLSMSDVMRAIHDIMKQVAPIVKQLGAVFGQLAQWFVSTGLPAIRQFGDFMKNSLLPILSQLGGFILTTVVPAIGSIANFIITQVIPAAEKFATWFGVKIMPIVEKLVQTFTQNVLPALEQVVGTILSKLVPALEKLIGAIAPILVPILGVLGFILQHVVGPALSLVINIISFLVTALADIIGTVGDVLGAIGDFVGGVLGFFGNLFDELLGHSIIPDLINGIISFFGQLPGKVLGIIGTFVGNLLGKIGELKDSFLGHIIALRVQVVGHFNDLKAKAYKIIMNLKDQIVTTIQELPDKFKTIGQNIIKAITDAIDPSKLINKLIKMASDALNGVKNIFGIKSPSKEFANIGMNLSQGLINGVQSLDVAGAVASHLGKASATVQASLGLSVSGGSGASGISALSAPLATSAALAAASGGSGSGSSQPLHIHVNVGGREIGRAILPDLVQAIRNGTGIKI